MHDQRHRILETRLGVRQREIENALGFRIHPARQIEARKIDPGRRALIGLGCRRRGDQRILPRDEVFVLIFAPLGDVENRPDRGWRALRADVGR